MSDNSKMRWFSSDFLRGAPSGEVDESRGIIEKVSVCTVGEAKGHGVHLDSEFIGRIAKLGAEKKQGLKARFGHPNMCSTALGTFIGRFKNFEVDGDQVLADLCLSNAASDTPHGDLRAYVLNMAVNEPDMFGTSIVFTPGDTYVRGEDGGKVYEYLDKQEYEESRVFVECDALHACDAVDEPAANDGFFSKFSGETIAGQMTEFFDLHPSIWRAVSENPEILGAIAQHGDRVDEFITKYRAYNAQGADEMDKTATAVETPESLETPEVAAITDKNDESTTAEPDALENKPAETTEPETPEESLSEQTEQTQETKPADDATLGSFDVGEFVRIVTAFGNDVAAQTVLDGGTYETALDLHAAKLAAENAKQAERIVELESAQNGGGKPAAVTEAAEAKEKTGLFKTGK